MYILYSKQDFEKKVAKLLRNEYGVYTTNGEKNFGSPTKITRLFGRGIQIESSDNIDFVALHDIRFFSPVTIGLPNYANNLVVNGTITGKDTTIDGLTSKGIANTGGFANIGDAVISGDLTVQGEGKGNVRANTLYQTTPTYDIDLVLPTETNITFTPAYMKAVMLENKLNIVAIFSMEYTGNVTQNKLFISMDIPEELASKIYDAKGVALNQSGTARMHIANMINTTLRTEAQLTDVGLNYYDRPTSLSRDGYGTANKARIEVREGIVNGVAGDKYYYELRGELTII